MGVEVNNVGKAYVQSRGFIVTIDALIAMLLVGGMVTSIIYLAGAEGMNTEDLSLQQIADDISIVLEKSGSIDQIVKYSNPQKLEDTVSLTKKSLCVRIELLDKEMNQKFYTYEKTGCKQKNVYTISRRQVLVLDLDSLNKWVIAEVRTWSK